MTPPDYLDTFGSNTDFVKSVAEKGVRLIVVGGLAVQYYCPDRRADDLDLLVEPTAHAGATIRDVLYRFNDAASFSPEEFAKPAKHYAQKRALYLDLLTPRDGVRFDSLWSRSVTANVNGVPMQILSFEDLLNMKRQAVVERGHEKDKQDLRFLERGNAQS